MLKGIVRYGRVMARKLTSSGLLVAIAFLTAHPARACLPVLDLPTIQISSAALAFLAPLQLDRSGIFDVLKAESIPEAHGCWSTVVGNFDGAWLSAGAVQWNLGSNTLQSLLHSFVTKFDPASLQKRIAGIMPLYGTIVFSQGCISTPITKQCQDQLTALQDDHGVLDSKFEAELNRLFGSNEMQQIQMDSFVALVGSIRDDLVRLFGKGPFTTMKIKWAIDSKIQMKRPFPSTPVATNLRSKTARMSDDQLTKSIESIIDWYSASSRIADAEGVKGDYQKNVEAWKNYVKSSHFTAEQADLLYLSYVVCRVADGRGGVYQGNAFERRAQIIFGFGSVGYRWLGEALPAS